MTTPTRFEAGLYSRDLAMAKEINSIVTDSTSDCSVVTLHRPFNIEQRR